MTEYVPEGTVASTRLPPGPERTGWNRSAGVQNIVIESERHEPSVLTAAFGIKKLCEAGMTDVHSKDQRSFNMSRIRSKDTKPELIVRSIVHQLGGRFRLHVKNLPGRPDLVFPSRRKVIFVHGCFWHMHTCRYGRVKPATNATFWEAKRQSNVNRDRRVRRELRADSWEVLVVWECWTRDIQRTLIPRIQRFLADSNVG